MTAAAPLFSESDHACRTPTSAPVFCPRPLPAPVGDPTAGSLYPFAVRGIRKPGDPGVSYVTVLLDNRSDPR